MTAIHLEASQVPAHLKGGYSGRKFCAIVCERVTIPADAGLWSGGTRSSFNAVSLLDGRSVPFPGQDSAPWNQSRRDQEVNLVPGVVIVESSMFCGKDMGLRFYVHPANAAALLPAPSGELSAIDKLVLKSRRFKSSYMGKDRYDMMRSEVWGVSAYTRLQTCPQSFPTRDEWKACEASLAARGLLNKAGAITVSGRNAIAGER